MPRSPFVDMAVCVGVCVSRCVCVCVRGQRPDPCLAKGLIGGKRASSVPDAALGVLQGDYSIPHSQALTAQVLQSGFPWSHTHTHAHSCNFVCQCWENSSEPDKCLPWWRQIIQIKRCVLFTDKSVKFQGWSLIVTANKMILLCKKEHKLLLLHVVPGQLKN